MGIVPAYCAACGAIFASPIFVGPGARVSGSNATIACPQCGADAQIVEGVFEGTVDALRIIRGSELSREIITAFARLLREAVETDLTPDDVRDRASAISPILGEAVGQLSKGAKIGLPALLLLLALSKCSFNYKVSLDVNQLVRDLYGANQQQVVEMVPLPKPRPKR